MDEIQPDTTDRDMNPAGADPAMVAAVSDPNSGAPMADPAQAAPALVANDPNAEDNTRKRQEQALMFEKYLEESGLCLSFQIIFTEIIQK